MAGVVGGALFEGLGQAKPLEVGEGGLVDELAFAIVAGVEVAAIDLDLGLEGGGKTGG